MRVKERFCETGLDSFADHNVLELVLFYSVPRKDTNELAHRLIEHFGSLAGVFEASVERLMEVKGVSHNTAVHIHLFIEVWKRYCVSKYEKRACYNDEKSFANYVISLFIGETVEVFYTITLDRMKRVICAERHYSGSVNTTEICIPEILDSVVKHKAHSLVIAHNHPGARPRPSPTDLRTTLKLKRILDEMGIDLVDHIIVGGNGKCTSLAALNYFDN